MYMSLYVSTVQFVLDEVLVYAFCARSVKHNLALVPSAVLRVACRAISITIIGLRRYLNLDYLFLQVDVEHCLAHRGSGVRVEPVSSGVCWNTTWVKVFRELKTHLIINMARYIISKIEDRRAGIHSSMFPDWSIYRKSYCRIEHWSHLFARNLRGRFQKQK